MNKFKALLVILNLSLGLNALEYGIATDVGNADTQEDTFSTFQNDKIQIFGVFDGEKGDMASKFLKNNLHLCIAENISPEEVSDNEVKASIKTGFIEANNQLHRYKETIKSQLRNSLHPETEDEEEKKYSDVVLPSPYEVEEQGKINAALSGAVVGVIRKDKLYIANVGDSVALLSRNGVVTVESKHNNNPSLFGKIEVSAPGRKNIKAIDIQPDCEFVVLASKGLSDVMDPQQVVDFVRAQYARTEFDHQELYPAQLCRAPRSASVIAADELPEEQVAAGVQAPSSAVIAQRLVVEALRLGSEHNITVIIINLKKNNKLQQLETHQAITLNHIQQMQRFMRDHSVLKKSILPMLLMMYLCRNKIGTLLSAMTKIMRLTNYQKAALLFTGGCWGFALWENKSSKCDSDDSSVEHDDRVVSCFPSAYSSSSALAPASSSSGVSFANRQVASGNGTIVRRVLQEHGLLKSGYHAIKNGICVYQEAKKGIEITQGYREQEHAYRAKSHLHRVGAPAELDEINALKRETDKKLLNNEEQVPSAIIAQRGDVQTVDNLSKEVIEKVLKEWNFHHVAGVDEIDGDDVPAVANIATWYSVISNELAQEVLHEQEGSLIDVVESFRSDLEKAHLFILGKPLGGATHWISIVVQKRQVAPEEFNFNYFVMNSYSNCAYKLDYLAQRLKHLIESQDIGLLKAIRDIGRILENSKLPDGFSKLRDHEREKQESIYDTLRAFEQIPVIIKKYNLQGNAILKNRFYKSIATVLEAINACALAPKNQEKINHLIEELTALNDGFKL
jgi:serine/threonine protein phosphatase PrpC